MTTVGVCSFSPAMATTIEVAKAADAARLYAVWTGELNHRSAIVALPAMAPNTQRCRAGRSIVF
jgi:alkanesulfonate monooxygenase SsuD/methylene tetrahydromethanopterin reductase-like flavin-dependent oxidoreductase (luciferase family)